MGLQKLEVHLVFLPRLFGIRGLCLLGDDLLFRQGLLQLRHLFPQPFPFLFMLSDHPGNPFLILSLAGLQFFCSCFMEDLFPGFQGVVCLLQILLQLRSFLFVLRL